MPLPDRSRNFRLPAGSFSGQYPSGSIAIRRKPGKRYGVVYAVVPLRSVARETRHMPPAFINRAGNDVTPAFLAYARPLVGPLPVTGRFRQPR